jgi:hypothetical protein
MGFAHCITGAVMRGQNHTKRMSGPALARILQGLYRSQLSRGQAADEHVTRCYDKNPYVSSILVPHGRPHPFWYLIQLVLLLSIYNCRLSNMLMLKVDNSTSAATHSKTARCCYDALFFCFSAAACLALYSLGVSAFL